MNAKNKIYASRIAINLLYIGFILPFLLFNYVKPEYNLPSILYPNVCNFTRNLYRGSTKRDALLLSVDKFHPGLELAVRSLRSTGSQCRIIILAARQIQITPYIKRLFKELDVEIYDNCINKNPSRNYVPHMLRYEFELQWIEQNIDKLDRVFHADAFDVYFQKDPFGPEIYKDKLMFVLEPHAFRSCGWNLAWMKRCYGDDVTQRFRDKYIICSGSIIGGAKPYLSFLKLMINTQEWETCWEPSLDQPIVNFLVYDKVLDENNIKYDITGCNGNFLTMQWCLIKDTIPMNQNKQVTSMVGTVPAFLHQYNRNKPLETQLRQRCRIRSK